MNEQPTIRRIVAGAIYDFAAGLTCRKEPITLGSAHHAGPAAEACQQFLAQRGCLEGEPMVRDWQDYLGTPAASSAYDRHQHFIAEVKSAAMAAGFNHDTADSVAREALDRLTKAKVV